MNKPFLSHCPPPRSPPALPWTNKDLDSTHPVPTVLRASLCPPPYVFLRPVTSSPPRRPSPLLYYPQTYNDLGNASDFRPALGGTKALPYPRRLATNRGDDSRGSEYPPAKGEKPWLPYGEALPCALYVRHPPCLRGPRQTVVVVHAPSPVVLACLRGQRRICFHPYPCS